MESNSWSAPWITDDRCQRHQAAQAEKDIAAWLTGTPHVAFDAFKKLLEPVAGDIDVFIEVGCGCGYYFDILMSFATMCVYSGYDISEDMVKYANARTPGFMYGAPRFHVADAANIPRFDSTVDVVCLAAVLQHLPDWQIAIREAVRMSRKFVMLHRVEGTDGATFVYNNCAYEAVLPTRIINEAELLDFCGTCSLTLADSTHWGRGGNRFNASYLLIKDA